MTEHEWTPVSFRLDIGDKILRVGAGRGEFSWSIAHSDGTTIIRREALTLEHAKAAALSKCAEIKSREVSVYLMNGETRIDLLPIELHPMLDAAIMTGNLVRSLSLCVARNTEPELRFAVMRTLSPDGRAYLLNYGAECWLREIRDELIGLLETALKYPDAIWHFGEAP